MNQLSLSKFSLGLMAFCLLSITAYAFPGDRGSADRDFWRLDSTSESYISSTPWAMWGWDNVYYYGNPCSSRPDSMLTHNHGEAGNGVYASIYTYEDFPEFRKVTERIYSGSSQGNLSRTFERLYSSTDKLLGESQIDGNNSYHTYNTVYTYNAADKLVLQSHEMYDYQSATMYTNHLKQYAYDDDNLLLSCTTMSDLDYDHELEAAYTVDLFYGVLPVPDSVLIWMDDDFSGEADWGEDQFWTPEPGRSYGEDRSSVTRLKKYSYVNSPFGYLPLSTREYDTSFWGGPISGADSILVDFSYGNDYHHQVKTTTRYYGGYPDDPSTSTKDYNSAWLLTRSYSYSEYGSGELFNNWAYIVPVEDEIAIPSALCIDKTAPNPFRESTKIRYSLAEASDIQLKVYNLRGQLVRKLEDVHQSKGSHLAEWDGKDEQGHSLPAGIYLLQLRSAKGSATARVVLLK